MKTVATENKVYEASNFKSWEEAIDFIKENLYMRNEPYVFHPGISDTPPEFIKLYLYSEYTNDDNEDPVYSMKISIGISQKNTLKDITDYITC